MVEAANKVTPSGNRKSISDGNELRVLWKRVDGNGDPNPTLTQRCMNNGKGHPTWKIFAGQTPSPIIRDKREPPHYVYLDDQACNAVYTSHEYNHIELHEYWPFDFDRNGYIKEKRANRGRPALLDGPGSDYATAPVRSKGKQYTFSGFQEIKKCIPSRQSSGTQGIQSFTEKETTTSQKRQSSVVFPGPEYQRSSSDAKKPKIQPEASGGIGAVQSGPFRKHITSKSLTASKMTKEVQAPGEVTSAVVARQPGRLTLNINTDKTSGQELSDAQVLRSQVAHLQEQLRMGQSFTRSIVTDNSTLHAYVSHLEAEREHYRKVAVMNIADKHMYQAELHIVTTVSMPDTESAATSQQSTPSIPSEAKKSCGQIRSLLNGHKTVLDEPSKYMYNNGMDEDYKEMEEEARMLNKARGAPDLTLGRTWNYS